MNPFYNQHIVVQWLFALILLSMAGNALFYWMDRVDNLALFLLLIFVITPVFHFFTTPFFRLIGIYKYVSPMLLVFTPNHNRYDLHNGTSFDYLFINRGQTSGRSWQNRLLVFYMEGLLQIIKEIEAGDLPATLQVTGCSYFFSQQTAARLGFTTKPTTIYEKLNILINYVDLFWMYSLSKGKISFPDITKTSRATITGANLVENKMQLAQLKTYLESRLA